MIEMISRNEKGKIQVRELDLRILFSTLYAICKTEHEVEWLNDQLTGCLEEARDNKIESLEEESEDEGN